MSTVILEYDERFGEQVVDGDKRSTIRRRKTAFKGDALVHKFPFHGDLIIW